jgi:hypothetical protein
LPLAGLGQYLFDPLALDHPAEQGIEHALAFMCKAFASIGL